MSPLSKFLHKKASPPAAGIKAIKGREAVSNKQLSLLNHKK